MLRRKSTSGLNGMRRLTKDQKDLLHYSALSLLAQPTNRASNKFTWGPILEVAILFLGIFITMAPALLILNAWGQNARPDLGPIPMHRPWHFFWTSGTLSSVLDNAPTYMTMAATACTEPSGSLIG